MATQHERTANSRMNEVLARLLRCLRSEDRVSESMTTGLDSVVTALDAEGAAVIRCGPRSGSEDPEVLHRAGTIGLPAMTAGMLLWRAEVGMPALSHEPNGRPIVVSVCWQNAIEKLGLVIWRRRGGSAWNGGDVPLVDSIAGIIWLLVERDASRRDLTRNMRTDPLTALLNQRSFVAEATRHMIRLDRDELPGTLMLAEVDNLEDASVLLGPDGGDQVLRRAAILLQSAVRPSDLVARTGDSEFAVWLSGADHLTAAERAEDLCLEAPTRVPGTRHALLPDVSFSIGIATRRAGESFADLTRRAGHAMREVKLAGGGYWRVSLVQPA
jgi:diguanylate cyclase (GGDEF)-like protein